MNRAILKLRQIICCRLIRYLFYISFLVILLVNGCSRKKYFQPEGIIDRTEELTGQGWTILNEKESIDGYTRIGDSIFGGEINCNVEAMKGVDIETFTVLAGTKYAKDKCFVYYPISIFCIDYIDCGVCYYVRYIVEDANPETFKYLGKGYAVDGKNVYFRGELIMNADGQTFKVLEGPEYFYFATDKNSVYKHNTVFNDADPETFYYDKHDSRNILSEPNKKCIIADKHHKWEFISPATINKIDK